MQSLASSDLTKIDTCQAHGLRILGIPFVIHILTFQIAFFPFKFQIKLIVSYFLAKKEQAKEAIVRVEIKFMTPLLYGPTL